MIERRFSASLTSILLVALAAFLFGSASLSAEKLNFGSGVDTSPLYYLPILAAEEKGFWNENGLEVKWVPFKGASAMYQGMAAGAVKIAVVGSVSQVQAVSRGAPAIIVAEHQAKDDWFLWVRTDSRFRRPEDLKGAKIGVTRLGGAQDAFGRMVGKVLGLEKDIKVVGAGGLREQVAGLKSGAIDAVIDARRNVVQLELAGEVRRLLAMDDYHSKEWLAHTISAQKEFVKTQPDTVKRTLRAFLRANDFVGKEPAWAVEKMKTMSGYSDQGAKLALEELALSRDGKINRTAVENVRNFLVDYNLVVKEKTPPVDELYTAEFTR